MLKEIDQRALNRIGKHADLAAFKQDVLLPHEELIMELPVVACQGLVTRDIMVGNGALMASKLTYPDGTTRFRLHVFIDNEEGCFYAKQRYRTDNLKDPNAEAEAEQFVLAKHKINGAFASFFVEENLVHVHSEVEETSRYAQRLTGKAKTGEGCCAKLCADCPDCPECPECPECPNCLEQCEKEPYMISWTVRRFANCEGERGEE